MTLPNDYQERLEQRASANQELYQSLKAKAEAKKTASEKLADLLTASFGTISFLILNAIVFVIWIAVNSEVFEGIEPFDPYPFSFLTMAVSLEAIFLAIIVLISQNRAGRTADLRQEVDLNVDVRTEAEITKLLEMVTLLLEKNGVDLSQDEVLEDMLQPTDLDELEEVLEQQVTGTVPNNKGAEEAVDSGEGS